MDPQNKEKWRVSSRIGVKVFLIILIISSIYLTIGTISSVNAGYSWLSYLINAGFILLLANIFISGTLSLSKRISLGAHPFQALFLPIAVFIIGAYTIFYSSCLSNGRCDGWEGYGIFLYGGSGLLALTLIILAVTLGFIRNKE